MMSVRETACCKRREDIQEEKEGALNTEKWKRHLALLS